MTGAKIEKQLLDYTRRSIKNCIFTVTYNKNYPMMIVTLRKGDFEPLSKGSGEVVLLAGMGKELLAKDLDSKKFNPLNPNQDLSKEAVQVFKKVIKYIKDNFSKNTKIVYKFEVSTWYENTGVIIAKPTEIAHKTFKEPKRRSVVERVISRVGGCF